MIYCERFNDIGYRTKGLIMFACITKEEFARRIQAVITKLAEADPDFDTALIVGRVNQYYLTGTMQDALLILKRNGSAYHFVRKSFDRAQRECPLDIVYPMSSYRDILTILAPELGVTYIDADVVTISLMERLKKYFKMGTIKSLDRAILTVRSIKSERELALISHSGAQQRRLMEDNVPSLLREGISEAEFQGELFSALMNLGHQGLCRFSMFQTEMAMGQFGFGDNSVYPTNFDGPGGMKGMSAASPAAGSQERRLKKGDLVFVDVGFGTDGYHSDKTQVYSFGKVPDADVMSVHRACIDIEKRCANLLVAGAIPSQIYAEIMNNLPETLSRGFMGYGQSVRFLGHGIGLCVDEVPVIAQGFDDPLAENMVIALEPKCGIPGMGTVGVEDSYIVRSGYSECITGGGRDIIVV